MSPAFALSPADVNFAALSFAALSKASLSFGSGTFALTSAVFVTYETGAFTSGFLGSVAATVAAAATGGYFYVVAAAVDEGATTVEVAFTTGC